MFSCAKLSPVNRARLWRQVLCGLVLWMFVPAGFSSTETGHYLLGPEDQLRISVWKEPELDRVVMVRPDGRISFPLVGELTVAGRSVAHVREQVTNKIRKYIPEAIASVSIEKISGYRIFVLGKVNSPGQYILGGYVDVIQALSLAEGLNPYASEKGIKIIRRQGESESVYTFNYEDIKQGEGLNKNIILKSGDVVIVP